MLFWNYTFDEQGHTRFSKHSIATQTDREAEHAQSERIDTQ